MCYSNILEQRYSACGHTTRTGDPNYCTGIDCRLSPLHSVNCVNLGVNCACTYVPQPTKVTHYKHGGYCPSCKTFGRTLY
ncbi:hypothetical protein BJV77DRAFT_996018 [Russula vinacea]|nr:hypothetical protein BJV77DRAFT_996018 [Russula vinacea]